MESNIILQQSAEPNIEYTSSMWYQVCLSEEAHLDAFLFRENQCETDLLLGASDPGHL